MYLTRKARKHVRNLLGDHDGVLLVVAAAPGPGKGVGEIEIFDVPFRDGCGTDRMRPRTIGKRASPGGCRGTRVYARWLRDQIREMVLSQMRDDVLESLEKQRQAPVVLRPLAALQAALKAIDRSKGERILGRVAYPMRDNSSHSQVEALCN
jgi:hypothetical protein